MKVIIDLRKYDGVVGGVERGALEIAINATKRGHDILLVCKASRESEVRELLADLGPGRLAIVPVHVRSHAISLANACLDCGFLQDLAEREGADLIHFFYNWAFPCRKKVPCLLTIHDVIPFTFREAMGWFQNHFLYRTAIRTACRLNDLVVTVSEFSRQDIAQKAGVPLSKIRVIPNGLRDPAKQNEQVWLGLADRFGLQKGYVLNVGGIHERKNIPRLIRAFSKLAEEESYEGRLVITGSVSGAPYQEKMKKQCDAAVAEAEIEDRVVFTGFISDRDLDILLRNADVFVYPSLYEGFGIPILEAMKVGTPVVTSNVTAMPEVAGDAGLLVDPTNVRDMARQIGRMLNDIALCKNLVAKGHERSADYSWSKNCEQYLAIYEELAGERGGPRGCRHRV